MSNPFTMVYEGLWTIAELNTNLLKYINYRNRIKYDDANEPKPNIADADLPELALINAGFDKIKFDCNNAYITKIYTWAITTGNYILSTPYDEVSFELFRALNDWEDTLHALSWESCNFVLNFRLVSAEEGTLMQDLERGIGGWSSLWSCEVDMSFPIAKLRL